MGLYVCIYHYAGLTVRNIDPDGFIGDYELPAEVCLPFIEELNRQNIKCTLPHKSDWDRSITHNLCEMAEHVCLANGYNLYMIAWHPDEVFKEPIRTGDVHPYLKQAEKVMKDNAKKLRKFTPSNGWGTYEGLLHFVEEYRKQCELFPNGYVYFDG